MLLTSILLVFETPKFLNCPLDYMPICVHYVLVYPQHNEGDSFLFQCSTQIVWISIAFDLLCSGSKLLGLNSKIPHLRVFPFLGGVICQTILISHCLSYFFNGKKDQFRYFVVKIIFQALSLEIKPLKSTLST